MASVLLRGRSSTTSRTMPRYTSSLTDLSRNGEIPMMNREGDSPLKPWPAAPESGGKKLRAQRPVTTTRNFSLLTFFSATAGQVVGFMLICCRGWANRHFSGGKWTPQAPDGCPLRRYRGGCAGAQTTDPESPVVSRLDPAAVPPPGERRTRRMRSKRTVDFPVVANYRLLRPGPFAHARCLPPNFSVPGSIERRWDHKPA